MRIGLLLIAAVVLTGCGRLPFNADSLPFRGGIRGGAAEVDGIRFRTRLVAERDMPRRFTTATRGASRNVAAALEAGRIRAVEYCVRRYGGSEIVWTTGPDRPVEEVAIGDGGALVLAGTCVTR